MAGPRTTRRRLPRATSRCASLLCALAAFSVLSATGCVDQNAPRSGSGGLFASPPVFTEPGAPGPRSAGAIVLAPAQITAPVGSEVILVASVSDRSGQAATDRRVEWMIGNGSVGEFTTIADRDAMTFFGLFGVSGKKISPTYMIGATSPRNILLTRGTPATVDDIRLAPGQTWASVTSAVEGVTVVTVFSPDVFAWDQRQRSATINWVSATAMPAAVPGIALPGAAVGGLVIPPMGAPGTLSPMNPGSPPPTLQTNPAQPGAAVPGAAAAANTLEVRVTGPTTAEVGADVQFTIDVFNRGAVKATGLLASDRYDAGFKHAVATGPIERPLADIPPGQSQQFKVTFRVMQQGRACHTVEVTSKEGGRASSQACITASPAPISPQARLKIQKTGPGSVRAGETAEFFITITNTSGTQLVNLRLGDTYGDNLEPLYASEGFVLGRGELTWTIPSLAAGQTITRQVNCRAKQAGRTSNRATISDPQGNTAADEVALDVR